MRWQLFGLIVVGVVAALCAAILVGSMKNNPAPVMEVSSTRGADPAKVQMVIAKAAIDRGTFITADMLDTEEVLVSQAPKGFYTHPSQAVGKQLVTPVLNKQPITSASFATDGPGFNLSNSLPQGMRAMSVSLSDYSGLDGLLYPGCAVDVLASFDLRSKGEADGGIISTTILRDVQVLAIEDRTAVSSEKSEDKTVRQPDRRRRVTLLVSPKQAQELQLAMEHGVISLAMRNPKDNTIDTGDDMTPLRELGPGSPQPQAPERVVYVDRPVEKPSGPAPDTGRKAPPWFVTVYKGGEKSTIPFEERPTKPDSRK